VIIERPFRCTLGCLPCLRPVMRVRHASVGYIGEIRQPSCPPLLNYHFNIYSPSRGAGSEDMLPGAPLHVHPLRTGEPPGTHWYTVRGELCQLSMFCFLPFAGCKRIRFPIFEASDVAFTKPVGEITKVFVLRVRAECRRARALTPRPLLPPAQLEGLLRVAPCRGGFVYDHLPPAS
jgi:hypothetical protein